MSNAWVTVASKARCAAPSAQRQPLLQLFRGFQQYHGSHAFSRGQETSRAIKSSQAIANARTTVLLRQQSRYSTSAVKSNRNSKAADDSKLQPATTSASHTEGAVEYVEYGQEDEEAVTWRDYDPAGGMPLPGGERLQAEIDEIFGSGSVDADTGNYVLSVMQWRRLSGALIDIGLDFPATSQISRSQAMKALMYLRSLDSSFDESAAGTRWAEEETERLREELRERAVSLKLYKAEDPVEEEESDQGTEYGREKTGQSALQRMREHNEAKWEREEAERAAREQQEQIATLHKSRGPLELSGGVQPVVALTTTDAYGDIAVAGAQTKAWLKPVERKEWVKYYEDQATIIKDNVVPQLSFLQRLGPATILALFTLTGLVMLSNQYAPPSKESRIFPDVPPAVSTLGAITAVMFATFVLSRMPIVWRASSKYFCIVPAYPYAISLLGYTWRHDTLSHLALNTITLWVFGLTLHEDVGRGTFLAIFLGSGLLGGLTTLVRNVTLKQWMAYSVGSSGGVLGVAAAACMLRPNGSVSIWGVEVPLVAWMLVGLYTAGELYGMLRLRRKTTTDHASHLGGLLAGVAAAYYVKLQRPVAGEQEMRHTPALQTVDV